jgi:hypothetical protein
LRDLNTLNESVITQQQEKQGTTTTTNTNTNTNNNTISLSALPSIVTRNKQAIETSDKSVQFFIYLPADQPSNGQVQRQFKYRETTNKRGHEQRTEIDEALQLIKLN